MWFPLWAKQNTEETTPQNPSPGRRQEVLRKLTSNSIGIHKCRHKHKHISGLNARNPGISPAAAEQPASNHSTNTPQHYSSSHKDFPSASPKLYLQNLALAPSLFGRYRKYFEVTLANNIPVDLAIRQIHPNTAILLLRVANHIG